MKLNNYKDYAPTLARIGLSLVFLWFGINQILFTEDWLIWLPPLPQHLFVLGSYLVFFNGLMEVILGTFLFLGLFTRFVALLLGLHLLPIIFTVGYNDVGVRDFGLMVTLFSIFIAGSTRYALDNKVKPRLLQHKILKYLYFFELENGNATEKQE